MNRSIIIVFLMFLTLTACVTPQPTLTHSSTTSPPTSTPPPTTPVIGGISESQAVAIAIATVPSLVLEKADLFPTLDQGTYWSIRVLLNPPITKNELGWESGPEVTFENKGLLPIDMYQTLSIWVDKTTPRIISRKASDNVFLGPIGTSPRNIEALAVVSVSTDPSQIPTPGGPAVEITLKNISSEPIISLTAVLTEPQTFIKNFRYDFAVSALSPLIQNQIASSKSLLITGAWGTGVSYYLTISGTFQNGTVFYFRWDPPVA